MLIISGTLLVLASWILASCVLAAIGLLPALISSQGRLNPVVIRWSLWWGLLVVAVFAYLANLAWPLRSAHTAWALIALTAIMLMLAWVVARRRKGARRPGAWHVTRRPLSWLLSAVLLLVLVYMAAAALGPVTNYDSGLYHLGAVQYAGEHATIHGLANLFFGLGYGNAEFPLAALLGNSPWGFEGFRLLNGLFMVVLTVDLLLRLHQRRLTVGFFVLALGLATAWIPLIALSDYWVTSPTQDSSVYIVTIAAVAYLADAVTKQRTWLPDASTALALGILLVLLRPTMLVFAGMLVAVLLVKAWSMRGRRATAGLLANALLVGVAAVVAGIAATARDYVLSGWVQYPLSLAHADVAWLAPDPTPDRLATLGYHRDASHLWESTQGWGWVGPWIGRLPSQWEFSYFVLLIVLGIIGLAIAGRVGRIGLRIRGLVLVLAPSAIAVVVWWVATPPSFRFIWGPLFMVPATSIGWAFWRLHASRSRATADPWLKLLIVCLAVPVALVALYSLVFRFHYEQIVEEHSWNAGVSVPYALAPVIDVPIRHMQLASGLDLTVPVDSDQCWLHFPLCTPNPASGLGLLGERYEEGLVHK